MAHTTLENKVTIQIDTTVILAEKCSVQTLFFLFLFLWHNQPDPSMSQIYFTGVTLYMLLARQYLFDICLLQYVQSLTPDDGRKDRPKHVECYSNKINLRH
jgi:hypothetical protein